MRCTSPRAVGFKADGKTISWSPRTHNKQYATWLLPCSKCLQCRLDYARQWAIRCVHEASQHPKNSFVTLTYETLKSQKLQYEDFQKFMKKLRKTQNTPIGVFVTGEYGDKTKRPHWHAILFNYEPTDSVYKYSNERGDKVYSSESLQKIWGHGIAEYGSVTFHSAGYCARYAAKKLGHGKDQDHDFHPISKKSSKHAIGKKWLEKYWSDIFNHGELQILLPNGEIKTSGIPRYYEKWLKQHKPTEWLAYVTQTKLAKINAAQTKADRETMEYRHQQAIVRSQVGNFDDPKTKNEIEKIILDENFKRLQAHLKL